VWLTPHLRDPQPEGEREREAISYLWSVGTKPNGYRDIQWRM